MSITAGFTKQDKCVHDEMMITTTIKGESTKEQDIKMAEDMSNGNCYKDIQKLQIKEGAIPNTKDCLHETILYTTMQKYIINSLYKKVKINLMLII